MSGIENLAKTATGIAVRSACLRLTELGFANGSLNTTRVAELVGQEVNKVFLEATASFMTSVFNKKPAEGGEAFNATMGGAGESAAAIYAMEFTESLKGKTI